EIFILIIRYEEVIVFVVTSGLNCILPCSFPPGDEVLGLQDQHFRGRTSLFKDQISRGTASIRLTGVEVQDEGRYKCYTSTISDKKESYINLNKTHINNSLS
uniref:Immunoglobulin V-set domain-containing protein n=1 Tax=Sander lucioperca TaxID=283035 RepID=A0A8D0DI79_SANLU